MWTGVVDFAELKEKSKWKVEYYCSGSTAEIRSYYPIARLGELFEERGESIDPQSYPGEVFNYVGLEHIETLTGDLVGFGPRPGAEIKSRSKVFRKGDVLYGRLRPYLNKVYLVDERLGEGICSGEFFVFRVSAERLLPNVARWLLASPLVQNVVAGRLTGAALPRLQLNDLLEIAIPVPPIEDQKKFERFIRKCDRDRRRMVRNLKALPPHAMNAFIASLENGKTPKLSLAGETMTDTTYENPLPPGTSIAYGRKRRATRHPAKV